MKKIILTITTVLMLLAATGCQQPNNFSNEIVEPSIEEQARLPIDYYEDESEEIEQEIVIEEEVQEDEEANLREEQLLKISDFEDRLTQSKTKLEEYKIPFETKVPHGEDNITEYLEYFLEHCRSHRDWLNKYGSEKNKNGVSNFTIAAAYAPYIEQIKKELKEVKAQHSKINSLFEETNNLLVKLDNLKYSEEIDLADIPERVAVLEYRVENFEVMDVQSLVGKYDNVTKEVYISVGIY